MDHNSFLETLKQQTPSLERWGCYVSEKLIDTLKKSGHPDFFIKIPAKPRVKTVESAFGKLIRKNYSDPLRQMTDLVGVRFVVLLSGDIDIVSHLIESETGWSAVVSRDFIEERKTNVKVFDYQSKHYEIRPCAELMRRLGMDHEFCCEVQVRTLLQHAYAEMVHDNIYKPTGEVSPIAERHVARSMALIETTDEIFSRTMELLIKGNEPRDRIREEIKNIYKRVIDSGSHTSNIKTANLIIDTFPEFINSQTLSDIDSLLSSKPFIVKKIEQRITQPLLFKESIILFIYFIVTKMNTDEIRDRWPLPGDWRSLDLVEADMNS